MQAAMHLLWMSVLRNGNALSSSAETVLVNASSTSGLESLMADGAYNGAERVSDQSALSSLSPLRRLMVQQLSLTILLCLMATGQAM